MSPCDGPTAIGIVAQASAAPTARRDRGSTSLSLVLVTPILVVLMFAGFQAALWNHRHAEARLVARETAVMVARDGLPAASAADLARVALTGRLSGMTVTVSRIGDNVVVVVAGDAPGILRGTSRHLTVRVAVPAEGWVAL